MTNEDLDNCKYPIEKVIEIVKRWNDNMGADLFSFNPALIKNYSEEDKNKFRKYFDLKEDWNKKKYFLKSIKKLEDEPIETD